MGIMVVLRIKDGNRTPEMKQKCQELFKRLERAMTGSAVDDFWVYDGGNYSGNDYKIKLCLSSDFKDIGYMMEFCIMPGNLDTLINVEEGGSVTLMSFIQSIKKEE